MNLGLEEMHWQQLMKQGNDCFDQQQWLQAEYFYQEAITSLDSLWQQDIENIELLMAWISGVHNLSALFEVPRRQPSRPAIFADCPPKNAGLVTKPNTI